MIEIKTHPKDSTRPWKSAKIRVYVAGENEPEWPVPGPSVRGDGSDADRAWKRYNREERRLQREVIDEVLAQDTELANHLGRLTWSRKAGCSCGCSPGWIAEGHGTEDFNFTRTPDEPTFAVADRVEHVDGRVGEVTRASTQVVVKFDDEPYPRYFAWNLANRDLTKTGVVVPDPNEAWLTAGATH